MSRGGIWLHCARPAETINIWNKKPLGPKTQAIMDYAVAGAQLPAPHQNPAAKITYGLLGAGILANMHLAIRRWV